MDQFTTAIKWETYYQDPAEGHADTDVLTITDTCTRCGGKGYFECYQDIEGGICFQCEGTPAHTYETTAATLRAQAKKRAQATAARARTAARKNAAASQNLADNATAWAGAYPAMTHFADTPATNLTDWEADTLNNLRHTARRFDLTANQAALAARIIQGGIDRAGTPEVKKPTAPMGKHEVTGTITKMTVKDTQWGPTVKITVTTEDGWKVYTTCPKAILNAVPGDPEGSRVAFTANLEPSNTTDLAFASRPSKARVL